MINLKSRGYPELLGLSFAYNAWVRSGIGSSAFTTCVFSYIGTFDGDYTDRRHAVRPASLDCDKFEKSLISRTFGSIARI